jgi:tetratricopeptide (TPR) repeat protein
MRVRTEEGRRNTKSRKDDSTFAPPASRSAVVHATAIAASVVLVFAMGCASTDWGEAMGRPDPVRISDLTEEGDAARRASQRLIVEGLDADATGHWARAQSRYDRAIQVDATNPYAYLAIARHHLQANEPERALVYLDRAEAMLRQEGADSPEVEPHLLGMRGEALYETGQHAEAQGYLARARELAPDVWGDGYLSPEELR